MFLCTGGWAKGTLPGDDFSTDLQSLVHHLLSKGSIVYATTNRSLSWQDSRVVLAILPNNEVIVL